MKRDNVNYISTGLVVLGALALLLIVLFRVTGRSGDSDQYYMYFKAVAGLSYGTPVYYEGYRVGQVSEVTPEREGSHTRFRVDIGITEGWPVPEDSIVEIASAGLLSDVFVIIHEGASEQVLSPGSQIPSREAKDFLAAFNDLAGRVTDLADGEISPLLSLLNERVDRITSDLETGTPKIVGDIEELVSRLNDSAASLQQILSQENREHIGNTLNNVELLTESSVMLVSELRDSRAQLDSILSGLDSVVSEGGPEAAKTLAELRIAAQQLGQRLDMIGFNLDEASRNLKEFARSIRQSPRRLLFSPEEDELETDL